MEAGGRVALLVFCCAVALGTACIWYLTREAFPIWVGEEQNYGTYVKNGRVGTLTAWIEGMEKFDGVECYVARYMLTFGDTARAGRLKFDREGRLRHVKVALVENKALKWTTEVGYSPATDTMRVIIKDNRDPENYSESDDILRVPGETLVPEYLWYLIRLERLQPGYRREFYLNCMPEAGTIFSAGVAVIGEEKIQTSAGLFDCWVVRGENTRLAPWPIDRVWVAKDGKFVVKAVELQDDIQFEYFLESYK